ncbi:nucleoside diphosphate-linked moiety X motif 19, mitochondrial [Entomortierella parvispora]|uniref:Nucleoside diphosphate-linked moiety X motif 19, mitochondrial n=1 Tax=Entomortierella parvispora TaxID=205924 RepID=A0A9P3H8Y0_9FUNG|nr:nucleoside diphosphate-linked moiety X motif 19, mitochondrial [Entomortierella parvispora]
MPLLKTYLEDDLAQQDRDLLSDILALGIKTDAALTLESNSIVAKTDGRIRKVDIDSLLDRILFPKMLQAIPAPKTASDTLTQSKKTETLSTGWQNLDRLLDGGWRSGEISEICSSIGAGKTVMCLHSAVDLLLTDSTALVIWIDAHSGGFSAQLASDFSRARIQQQQLDQGQDIEEVISSILSRIQVFVCQDAYEVLDILESLKKTLELPDPDSPSASRLVVIDSLARTMNGVLRLSDGVGHATMMHTMRVLRGMAQQYALTVLVVTSTVLLSENEQQAPSILSTNKVKPGLGSSWKYATDLQLFISKTRSDQVSNGSKRDYSRIDSDLFNEDDTAAPVVSQSAGAAFGPVRVAEVMRSKRLKIGECEPSDHHLPSMLKIALASSTRERLGNLSSRTIRLFSSHSLTTLKPSVRTPSPHSRLQLQRSNCTSVVHPPNNRIHFQQQSRYTTMSQITAEERAQLRPSSSLIIAAPISKSKVQPGKANYKILLLQRSRKGTAASAHVFPGGNVEKADHDPRWATLLNYTPKPDAPPLFSEICAIREAFEESGVLVSDPPTELSNHEIRIWREKVHNNAEEFYNLCITHNLKPAVGRLCHFSSWITPPVEAKRFHTHFYLTVLPWSRDSFSDSRVFADGTETTRLDWHTPEEAIEAYRNNEIQTFLPPQFVTLAHLLPIQRHEDLVAHFQGREILTIMPEFALESQDEKGLHLSGILPGDEEHSLKVTPGHKHRIHITRTKKGMNIRSYAQGSTVVKARL